MAEHALDALQPVALLDKLGGAGVAQLVQRVARPAGVVGEAGGQADQGPLVVQGIVAEAGAAVRAKKRGMGRLPLRSRSSARSPRRLLGVAVGPRTTTRSLRFFGSRTWSASRPGSSVTSPRLSASTSPARIPVSRRMVSARRNGCGAAAIARSTA